MLQDGDEDGGHGEANTLPIRPDRPFQIQLGAKEGTQESPRPRRRGVQKNPGTALLQGHASYLSRVCFKKGPPQDEGHSQAELVVPPETPGSRRASATRGNPAVITQFGAVLHFLRAQGECHL